MVTDMKNIFANLEGYPVNLGRGEVKKLTTTMHD
jgi:hypothetical protein